MRTLRQTPAPEVQQHHEPDEQPERQRCGYPPEDSDWIRRVGQPPERPRQPADAGSQEIPESDCCHGTQEARPLKLPVPNELPGRYGLVPGSNGATVGFRFGDEGLRAGTTFDHGVPAIERVQGIPGIHDALLSRFRFFFGGFFFDWFVLSWLVLSRLDFEQIVQANPASRPGFAAFGIAAINGRFRERFRGRYFVLDLGPHLLRIFGVVYAAPLFRGRRAGVEGLKDTVVAYPGGGEYPLVQVL